jgi:hypothetical protein
MQRRSGSIRPTSRLALALACLAATFSLRCGSDDDSGPPAPGDTSGGAAGQPSNDEPGGAPVTGVCEPGATRECVGAGACRGGQACLTDGSAWSPCDCGDSPGTGGAGGEPATGTEGGMASMAGAGGASPIGCSPEPPTGCAADEKCAIVDNAEAQTTEIACVPDGNKQQGDACAGRADGSDDCGEGLFCSALGYVAQCQPYCNVADPSACATSCTELDVSSQTGESTPSGYGVCLPSCDLLEQDCADGNACVFVESPFPVCAKFSSLADGEDCEFYNQCEKGAACVLVNADKTSNMCTPLCDATVAGSCDATGDTCLAFDQIYSNVTPEMATIGLCYPCALLDDVQCELLAPGGCDEESDCDPLLDSTGADYTCDVTATRCVHAPPP